MTHRRLAPRALLAVAGLSLGLLAAEVLVRIAGAAPEVSPIRRGRLQLSDDPGLVFEPVPGMVVEGKAGLWEAWSGAANRLGYRDRDRPAEKPAGTFRVVVLGDSIAAGWGIGRTADVFPALLERRLAAAGGRGEPRVEVLNFAVAGYNTAQEVATLAGRALAFDPDLVLLAYCLNDRREPDPRIVAALAEEAARPAAVEPSRLASGLRRLAVESALWRWLRYVVLAEPVAVPGAPGEGFDPEARPPAPDEILDRFDDDEAPVAGPSMVEAAFDRLAGLSRDEGGGRRFAVAVAVFPYLRGLFRDRFADHHEHVAALAARHGFSLIDLRRPFRECAAAADEPIALDRYHPTELGHRCAAEAIAERLLAEGLVPAPSQRSRSIVRLGGSSRGRAGAWVRLIAERMAIPIRTTTPTPIHIGGMPARWAPHASPTTTMMKPIR